MRYQCAFFDVDETIISFKTMFDFLKYFYDYTQGEKGNIIFEQYMASVKNDWKFDRPREEINREYYMHFEGVSVQLLDECIQNWYQSKRIELADNFFIEPVIDEVKKLCNDKTPIVLVSGSLYELIKYVANDIGATTILATRIESNNGVYTGHIIPPQTIGEGKAEVVHGHILKNGLDKAQCIAYGDHYSDFQMISTVDHGVIVSNNKTILKSAEENGWRTITNI
ncbi:HAD family hydrolase [Vibrio aestuarianus]|uniref:HAD family hydrolase n=1 Tax=Vibrio aestuarianus TaxID=28171 RepID=UPI00237CAE69|nr:HAD-IB family hydrolase [Vibrio aestuarianus]MDE1330419.1 HAD-IB family hydrolase [Vibrio aestuarianus]